MGKLFDFHSLKNYIGKIGAASIVVMSANMETNIMMTALIIFVILSIFTSVIVVAACVKSAQVTQWENTPETFETAPVSKATPRPKVSRRTAMTL